jgi:hypothetical protein
MSFGKRQRKGYGGIERRGGDRAPTDMPAEIILPDGTIVPCRVVDLSKTGARLSVSSILGIPEILELRNRGMTHRVQVVRRSPRSLSVKFVN